MARIMFPSLTYGDRIGYLLTSDYNHDHWRIHGSDHIHPHAKHYDTYGDGFVQHSQETPIPIKYLGDWCASLAMFIQAEAESGRRDAVELLAKEWPERNNPAFERSKIIKASKIRYKGYEDSKKAWKRQYINMEDLAVSTADSKRHDKRWRELPESIDGTVEGIFYLLNLSGRTLSGLECYMRYKRIIEVMDDLNDEKSWCPSAKFEKVIDEDNGWTHYNVRDAFNAFEYAVKAEMNRDWAERAARSLRSNIDWQLEKRAKAAGLTELTEEVAAS